MVDGDDVPRGLNLIALKRRGLSGETIQAIEDPSRGLPLQAPRTQVIQELAAREDLARRSAARDLPQELHAGQRGRYLEAVRMPL